jgi:hypothetical protein
MKFTFKSEQSCGTTVEMTFDEEHIDEIEDMFKLFLRGSGFYVPDEEDMYTKQENVYTSEGWDPSDMAHRSGGLSVEQAEKDADEWYEKALWGEKQEPDVTFIDEGNMAQEPVAWVRDLTSPQPHCVTSMKYLSIADTDAGVKYIPVYTAPPKQEIEQKPVAWMVRDSIDGSWYPCAFENPAGTIKGESKPLYTAPPKRERPVKSYTGGMPQYATETPDDILRQSEREGWRYAKECESEIKRLKELAEYRLQLLMKMPENKPVMRMLSKGEEPPTKRVWVGLTEEERCTFASWLYYKTVNEIFNAIEAKLRERNT